LNAYSSELAMSESEINPQLRRHARILGAALRIAGGLQITLTGALLMWFGYLLEEGGYVFFNWLLALLFFVQGISIYFAGSAMARLNFERGFRILTRTAWVEVCLGAPILFGMAVAA
jgi:hypothetical protein